MSESERSRPRPILKGSEAVFAARDIRQTVDFYREVLGFESHWYWGDPPNFAGVRWGEVQLMFCLDSDRTGTEGLMHWFRVDDVNGLYARHKDAGAPIIHDIENKPWGVREYTVRDPNGYHLRFAGDPNYERPAGSTDVIPEQVRIEVRVATVEEYAALRQSVNWSADPQMMRNVIAQTPIGVVALDTRENRTVGMVRVCGDGNYFTIWDVIVRPEYQGRKIGSALMEMAMDQVKQACPKGAFVALFTPKPAFYQRLGFAPNSSGMTRTW